MNSEVEVRRKFNQVQRITRMEAAEIMDEIRAGATLKAAARKRKKCHVQLGQWLRRFGYSPQLEKKHATFRRRVRDRERERMLLRGLPDTDWDPT